MNTFADVVVARAGDEAVGVVSDGECLTWGVVVQQAADRAALLSEMRTAGRQVHVGVLLENVPDYLFWTCAAALAGAVVVVACSSSPSGECHTGLLHSRYG